MNLAASPLSGSGMKDRLGQSFDLQNQRQSIKKHSTLEGIRRYGLYVCMSACTYADDMRERVRQSIVRCVRMIDVGEKGRDNEYKGRGELSNSELV